MLPYDIRGRIFLQYLELHILILKRHKKLHSYCFYNRCKTQILNLVEHRDVFVSLWKYYAKI